MLLFLLHAAGLLAPLRAAGDLGLVLHLHIRLEFDVVGCADVDVGGVFQVAERSFLSHLFMFVCLIEVEAGTFEFKSVEIWLAFLVVQD